MELDLLREHFTRLMPDTDFCSFRYDHKVTRRVSVRGSDALPYQETLSRGVMVTIHDKGGIGYASTADLSEKGLKAAIEKAKSWAHATSGKTVFDFSSIKMPSHKGSYRSPVESHFSSKPILEHFDYLKDLSESLKGGHEVVDRWAGLINVENQRLYVANNGADIEQSFSRLSPNIGLRVSDGHDAIERSSAGDWSQQRGLEFLDFLNLKEMSKSLKEEALELLSAPNCPSDSMDLLLDADQMLLQIHESIGHPLELDRILGDERNYAGTSFVTMDMFGSFKYGSDLLNITFDPTVEGQFASYAYDDDGEKAEKTYIIKEGVLKTPLGGSIAQKRAGLSGVANARSVSWNRPSIDRMANLNMEPGNQTFDDLVSKVERGIYMKTNQSWSIDDSRNKFQFGCQYGRLIENGKLTKVVKKPNYRGISSSFWKSLKGVGDISTWKVMGTPNCGKGEPNQAINVGHASPACLFSGIDVFGGQE